MKGADRKKLEEIADDLMGSVLVFSRRLAREGHHPGGRKFDPSRFVLKHVNELGPVAMSDICRHMEFSKPYMTALVDKLIAEGLVERVMDPTDRRVVKIMITQAGREVLRDFKRAAREAVISRLSSLDSKNISALHDSMRNIRSILSKVDEDRT